jgi:hypothetical protein
MVKILGRLGGSNDGWQLAIMGLQSHLEKKGGKQITLVVKLSPQLGEFQLNKLAWKDW